MASHSRMMVSSVHTADPRASPKLLQLPPEVRLMIYDIVLEGSNDRIFTIVGQERDLHNASDLSLSLWPKRRAPRNCEDAVLLVCRQITDEVKAHQCPARHYGIFVNDDHVYDFSQAHVTSEVSFFSRLMGPDLSFIKHIEIGLDVSLFGLLIGIKCCAMMDVPEPIPFSYARFPDSLDGQSNFIPEFPRRQFLNSLLTGKHVNTLKEAVSCLPKPGVQNVRIVTLYGRVEGIMKAELIDVLREQFENLKDVRMVLAGGFPRSERFRSGVTSFERWYSKEVKYQYDAIHEES